MKWFRTRTDDEFIESLRKGLQTRSPMRQFFGVIGILMFTFFFAFVKLVDRMTADMALDRACVFAGFAFGAMFGLVAMLMVLQGVVAFMQCLQRGPICRTQRLLVYYHDQIRGDKDDNKLVQPTS